MAWRDSSDRLLCERGRLGGEQFLDSRAYITTWKSNVGVKRTLNYMTMEHTHQGSLITGNAEYFNKIHKIVTPNTEIISINSTFRLGLLSHYQERYQVTKNGVTSPPFSMLMLNNNSS